MGSAAVRSEENPSTGKQDDQKAVASTESGEARPDIHAIMGKIRERIARDVESNRDALRPFTPAPVDSGQAARKAGELLHSEELRYLNQNYHFARLNLEGISSHRPGFVGKLIVKFKRKVMQMIWDTILRDYLSAERDFQANLVRFLNDVSKYVDSRDASNFWELIRKIDVDITRALERIERIGDEQSASLRATERSLINSLDATAREFNSHISKLQSSTGVHTEQLKVLDSVARGLESVVARLEVGAKLPAAQQAEQGAPAGDYSYLMLENRFRGSEEEIRSRLEHYVPRFKGATLPILEIGGGRGELQQLFREQGIRSYCVDMDRAMVESSVAKGMDARLGDGIAHLRTLADKSLGGIIAIQVVEHLNRIQLEELMREAKRVVQTGGRIIFETINPQSVLALSSNYFRDPTHVFPMHPDTLRYMMDLAGIKKAEVVYLSPVPDEAQLRSVEVDQFMTPRWAHAVELLNRNTKLLNQILFGAQDFCIIGEA